MKTVDYFHDSCIKEIKYISGAYVKNNLSMYPINDCRTLSVAIQCQQEKLRMIELEFVGLNWMRLFPVDEHYTCEILDASLLLKEDRIYWFDCGNMTESDINVYDGTVICSSNLRWRTVENFMGKNIFYKKSK